MSGNYKTVIFLSSIILFSCSTPQKGLFTKQTPHEKYADKLTGAGLKETALGNKWFTAADKGMRQPLNIELPYKEMGYFSESSPDAAGFKFNVRHGENVQILISSRPAGFSLFADVWMQEENGTLTLIASADTINHTIQFESEKDALYQLRMQPQLLAAGAYTLTIITTPSLAFPVPATSNPKVGSFWGASRDAGNRKHEGIDIFGKFRTPVLAAAGGVVTSTRQNNLGGKVVFIRPDHKNYTLYYAHLDSQLVTEGQRVAAGQAVGLMGNTGNAKNTPTHLHFGIYTGSGAVDPFPFVHTNKPEPAAIKASPDYIDSLVRTGKKTTLFTEANATSAAAEALQPYSLLKILAATDNWYKVKIYPAAREGFVQAGNISTLEKALRTVTLKQPTLLLDQPDSTAAARTLISANSKVKVLAEEKYYLYAAYNNINGWISK